MGNFFSFYSDHSGARNEIRVLIAGTSAAGKTSVLHNIFGDASTDPTTIIQPLVATVNHNGTSFAFFDVSYATRTFYYPSWGLFQSLETGYFQLETVMFNIQFPIYSENRKLDIPVSIFQLDARKYPVPVCSRNIQSDIITSFPHISPASIIDWILGKQEMNIQFSIEIPPPLLSGRLSTGYWITAQFGAF